MTQTQGTDPPMNPLADPDLKDPGPIPVDPGPRCGSTRRPRSCFVYQRTRRLF